VSVKVGQRGFSPAQICQGLTVSPQYVSKGKGQDEAQGAAARRLGPRGSEGDLREADRPESVPWSGAHETARGEAGRDYGAERDGVVYQSQPSSSELRAAGGMSSHRPEEGNPKRDAARGWARRQEIKKAGGPGGRRLSGRRVSGLVGDACHRRGGDGCGTVGGNRHTPLAVPMTKARQRHPS
jgi:hypothetical protein